MENDAENLFKIVGSERDYGKIGRENMETYLSASAQVDLLKALIISPFESKLKESTGYDEENLPAEKTTIEKRIGNHMFYIDVSPSAKVKYFEVYTFMNNYFNGLEHGKAEGKKREGVRSVEEGAFVSLDDVVENFNKTVSENTQAGFSVSVKTSKGKESIDITKQVLQIDYGRDYSAITGEGSADNARDFIEARKMVKKLEKIIIDPFEGAVKKATGFDKANIPSEVTYTKNSVGNVLCYGVNSPADNVEYSNIIKEFGQYLSLLGTEAEITAKSTLPELKRIEGKAFVKLSALQEHVKNLKEEYTSTNLRQNIYYLRRPRDDKIVIE